MIIGLTGKAGSGKDSVADHLVKNHGFFKLSFAAPLKRIICELFDMSEDQVNKQELKEVIDPRYGFTPRWLLQHFGTEVCRKLYPSIWVDYLIRYYKKNWYTDEGRVVVTDVRFLNEARAISNINGKIWRVTCLNNPKDLGEGSTHASEVEQDNILVDQELIAEYGNLPQLFKEADEAIKEDLDGN